MPASEGGELALKAQARDGGRRTEDGGRTGAKEQRPKLQLPSPFLPSLRPLPFNAGVFARGLPSSPSPSSCPSRRSTKSVRCGGGVIEEKEAADLSLRTSGGSFSLRRRVSRPPQEGGRGKDQGGGEEEERHLQEKRRTIHAIYLMRNTSNVTEIKGGKKYLYGPCSVAHRALSITV